MKAGNLRHRVTFQNYTVTSTSGTGQQNYTWTNVTGLVNQAADYQMLSGGERTRYQQLSAKVSGKVTMRDSGIDIQPRMRVLVENEYYRVSWVERRGKNPRWLVVYVEGLD